MKTFENVTMRDIETLAEWGAAGQGNAYTQRLVKRARSRGNNGHFAALKQIATMINEKRGPWAPPSHPEEA